MPIALKPAEAYGFDVVALFASHAAPLQPTRGEKSQVTLVEFEQAAAGESARIRR